MCDCTFAHFSEQNVKISCFRTSFSCFRTSFPVLEHPFPVLEHPFLVLERPLRTAYSDLEIENPKNCWKNVNLQKVCGVRVWSATTLGGRCAHVCVRTYIWTCEVRACDPKKGRNPCLVNLTWPILAQKNSFSKMWLIDQLYIKLGLQYLFLFLDYNKANKSLKSRILFRNSPWTWEKNVGGRIMYFA